MKRFVRWFKSRRQLLAEIHNLERAVRDHQHKETLTLAALAEINAQLQKLSEAKDQLATDALALTLFGMLGRNNGE